jgi:hypothetical protein
MDSNRGGSARHRKGKSENKTSTLFKLLSNHSASAKRKNNQEKSGSINDTGEKSHHS